MNSEQILAIQEFRRFVNLHIYPQLASTYIIPSITSNFNVNIDTMIYENKPQAMIKFKYGLGDISGKSYSDITIQAHTILKSIFINFFNNPDVIKTIRNKIYTSIEDENLKQYLNLALSEIQCGNQQYLGLLFNITFLKDLNIYLYL